jgi:hypothetical protein
MTIEHPDNRSNRYRLAAENSNGRSAVFLCAGGGIVIDQNDSEDPLFIRD